MSGARNPDSDLQGSTSSKKEPEVGSDPYEETRLLMARRKRAKGQERKTEGTETNIIHANT